MSWTHIGGRRCGIQSCTASACLPPKTAFIPLFTAAWSWTLALTLATTPSMRQLTGAGALRSNGPHAQGNVANTMTFCLVPLYSWQLKGTIMVLQGGCLGAGPKVPSLHRARYAAQSLPATGACAAHSCSRSEWRFLHVEGAPKRHLGHSINRRRQHRCVRSTFLVLWSRCAADIHPGEAFAPSVSMSHGCSAGLLTMRGPMNLSKLQESVLTP